MPMIDQYEPSPTKRAAEPILARILNGDRALAVAAVQDRKSQFEKSGGREGHARRVVRGRDRQKAR